MINVGNEVLSMLYQIIKASNKEDCANFETRINERKEAIRKKDSPQQQFEELDKIEGIYDKIIKEKEFEVLKQ